MKKLFVMITVKIFFIGLLISQFLLGGVPYWAMGITAFMVFILIPYLIFEQVKYVRKIRNQSTMWI